jgi:phosphoribosylglycinamide formyltransferase-1
VTLPVPAAVFASGSGTNLQALLDAEKTGRAAWRTRLVISDRLEAGALDRATGVGIQTMVIRVAGRDPAEVEEETLTALRNAGVGVIFLAGYLRLVPAGVIARFPRRILNIHPALLPSFGGKGMYGPRVHEAVLAAGARISGPTVHFVDERYDEGTIFAQWPVPVRLGDTPDTLAARVLSVEHRLYPLAAQHLAKSVAEGREPGPFQLAGGAWTLADVLDDAAITRRFRETFTE